MSTTISFPIITIHSAVKQKLEWLMSQQSPAKAVVGFINDCLGWQRQFGLSVGVETRAMRFIAQVETGEIDTCVLAEFAAPIITQLAYVREGARERQMESPDEPVRLTQEWWLERPPGWAFA